MSKKICGGIMICIGIVIAIPVGLRIMHLMGYLVGLMFDPVSISKPYSISFIATTVVLISIMILLFRYGSKFCKGEEKSEESNNSIDSGMDR